MIFGLDEDNFTEIFGYGTINDEEYSYFDNEKEQYIDSLVNNYIIQSVNNHTEKFWESGIKIEDIFISEKEQNKTYPEDLKIANEITGKYCNINQSSKNNTPYNTFENSNKDLTITGNISQNINNNINNDNFSYINDNTEKKNENILIGRKRRLFNISYPKTFNIFNKGGNDNYIRQLIKESLQNNKEYFFSKNSIEIIGGKDRDDNMRKKIKTRFCKILKNTVNKLLSLVGSKRIFDNLPQEFIINISKELNKGWLDLTFKELYSKNFCKDKINDNPSLKKYKDNQSVLQYLDEEKEISKNSKYDIFKDMKYYQIFNEYLRSEEFEKDILQLKENYDNKYIKNYIRLAFDLLDFFNY